MKRFVLWIVADDGLGLLGFRARTGPSAADNRPADAEGACFGGSPAGPTPNLTIAKHVDDDSGRFAVSKAVLVR